MAGNGKSPVYSTQITRKTILQVVAGGFALVIFSLVAAAFVGLQTIESIQQSVARLEEGQAVTTHLIDEMQDEQAALTAVFYKLSRDPASVDRDSILADLDASDEHIDRIVSESKGTPEEPTWQELQKDSHAFAEEARRLLGLESATTLLSRDLYHRHDQVVSLVGRLTELSHQKSLEAQNQIRIRSRDLLIRSSILLGACLILALVCAAFTVRTTTELFRKMQVQTSELSRVSWHLLENQESAARRFSHELHDELGQSLTALKASLLSLQSSEAGPNPRLQDGIHLVEEALRNVRELSHLLRPTILDDFGLDAGLLWLTERFAQRTGIDVDYGSNFKSRLPDETETHLFRIAQEALTNVARHSGAKHVKMKLQAYDSTVALSIQDDGRGLPETIDTDHGGLGLVGMRARARSAGGEMQVLPVNGSGVRIEVRVPQGKREADEEKDPHLVGG